MSYIDLATRFNWNVAVKQEKACKRFSEIIWYNTSLKWIVNQLDILRYHMIDGYALHTSTTRKKQI